MKLTTFIASHSIVGPIATITLSHYAPGEEGSPLPIGGIKSETVYLGPPIPEGDLLRTALMVDTLDNLCHIAVRMDEDHLDRRELAGLLYGSVTIVERVDIGPVPASVG